MLYAAIETSFDETGIAICDADGHIVTSLLASQVKLHQPYGGCVPELAARTHLSDLPQMWRKLDPGMLDAVTHLGVTAGPGLPGCLLAGISFARGVARALKIPLYGLNHLTGHIFSPFIPQQDVSPEPIPFPHLALLISGGHTELYLVRSLTEIELLGQTLDDAVGELLDKVSAVLGYGYPGGAVLEQIASSHGNAASSSQAEYRLPVPMRNSGDLNFSYSGLKTAILRVVRLGDLSSSNQIPATKHPALLAALFSVVSESLWIKVKQALSQYPIELLTLSGGVAINNLIRKRFEVEARKAGIEVRFPALEHCLDNAEMLAWLLKLTDDAGIAPVMFDADSNWNPGIRR